MTARNVVRASLRLVGALVLACTRDDRSLLLAPSYSLEGDPTWSGAVLGPDASSICSFIPAGSVVRLRPIDPAAGDFAAPVQLLCPANTFAFSLAPGSYLLRAILPPDPAIGSLPQRHVEQQAIDGGDVVHDVVVQNGTPLGGSATLDGAPLADVVLAVVYDQAPGFLTALGASGAEGTWTEFFRPPMILQNNVRYQVSGGCGALGVLALEGAPASGFMFPSDVSAINCTLITAPSVQFSHGHTRLVVTPMPGDIGGQSVELADRYGIGWGVQFPVGPGHSPVHVPVSATHLFGGGLMIGIAPDRILSGLSVAGQLDCGAACRDLGLDGTVSFTDETPAGKKVIWHYSDATSPEGVGLRVVQRSFDGQLPNDYVLSDFSIQNGGPSAVTFYAGVFMDWDVDEDPADDFGFTDLDGQLMGVTSAFESGVHVGSLLVGASASGNLFYNFTEDAPPPSSTAQQFQALSGAIRRSDIVPGDAHYIHGVGPVTLARGKKADIWLGVIAGDDRAQFLANARAAAADIATRQQSGGGGGAADVSHSLSLGARGVPVRPIAKGQKPQ